MSPNSLITNGLMSHGLLTKDVTKGKDDKVSIQIGSVGETFVQVRHGDKVVNVTTVFGFGLGAVTNLHSEGEMLMLTEVQPVQEREMRQLLSDVAPTEEEYMDDKKDSVSFFAGAGAKTGAKLRHGDKTYESKTAAGWVLGGKTKVSKN